jgi:hypothetical protein
MTKFIRKSSENKVHFEHIAIGECFDFDGRVYMKSDETRATQLCQSSTCQGYIVRFACDTPIELVEIEIREL